MTLLAVDTETTGTDFFHGCRPFMITACDGKSNYYWEGKVDPYNRAEVTWNPSDLKEAYEFIQSYDTLVFHNAKFDVRALHSIGVDLTDQWHRIEDTMIASHVVCSGESHALKTLAFKYLGYYNEGQRELKRAVLNARAEHKNEYDLAKEGHPTMPGTGGPGTKWYTMDYWLCMEECRKYGIDDVEMTWLLWKMYESVMLQTNQMEVYETRRALLEITYKMQSHGMHLYTDKVNLTIKAYEALRKTHAAHILKECRIANALDFNNQDHIRFFLFDVLELPITDRSEKTGKPLMNKEVIESYIASDPENTPLQHFSDYRLAGTKIGYLKSYLKWVDDNSYIHSDLLITGTRETRQASRNPNTQNIDKKLKDIFGPPPGKVWYIYDLVNIELRIWGYQVGNEELTAIFNARKSFHAEIAKTIYPDLYQQCLDDRVTFKARYGETLYQWIKNGNFSVIYGAGENKANSTYRATQGYTIACGKAPTQTINAYSRIVKRFPEVPSFTAKTIQTVHDNERKYGYPFITCLGGYNLDINPDKIYTTACNFFCQGSAGYIIGLAMQEVHNNPDYQRTGSQMVNQVHDSLYIEVPIEHNTPSLQESLKRSIEAGGEKLLPTCEAELETIIYNPMDKSNE